MTGDGGTPQAALAQAALAQGRRSRRQAWRARPADWRWLPALLCALATALSVTLSACGSFGESTCSNGGDMARKTPFYGLTVSPPIAAGGVVYVGYAIPDATGNPDRHQYAIAALRAHDGMALWRVPATGETWPLAVADGILLVFSRGAGGLVGLRASDGITLWHVVLPGLVTPVLPRGHVLYVTTNSGVDALRLADGHILWQYPMADSPLLVPPVVDGTSVYAAGGDGSVVALQAATGAVRWTVFPGSKPSPNVWYIPVAAAAGQLYIKTSGGQGVHAAVLRLNPVDGTNDGEALLLPPTMNILTEYPALLAGDFSTVFLPILLNDATPSGPPPTLEVYRLSASGGTLLWRSPPLEDLFMPVGLAHDAQTLYFAARRAVAPLGMIYAFRLADGAELWRQQALADTSAGIGIDAGYLFETVAGVDVPQLCHTPPVHQAPRIRALTSADGGVAWTQALDATR